MTATPNHALQRTGSAVTAPAPRSPPPAGAAPAPPVAELGVVRPMKLLLMLLLPVAAFCAEPDIARIPWPKPIRDFPRGDKVTFTSGRYEIGLRVPDDPKIQASGGSDGPMVEFTLRDLESRWSATFMEQSVGERLLVPYGGKPQIEIWGRGGGGSWSRSLYRYVSGEYCCVRTDDFEETPRHNNQKALTTEMPSARRGKGDQQSETLYFVETRL